MINIATETSRKVILMHAQWHSGQYNLPECYNDHFSFIKENNLGLIYEAAASGN